jgi:hypothetical protein
MLILFRYSLFSWAATAPLLDLPKLSLLGLSIRINYLLLIPIIFNFVKKVIFSFNEMITDLKRPAYSLFSFVLLLCLFENLFLGLHHIKETYLPLIFLLVFWSSILGSETSENSKILFKGFFTGQIINSFFSILIHFFYPNIFYPEKIKDFFFNAKLLRAYGFSGEPSYFSISVFPLIIFLSQKKLRVKNFFLLFLLILGSFLSYSRLGMYFIFFNFFILFFSNLYFKRHWSFNLKKYFLIFLTCLSFSIIRTPQFFYDVADKQNNKYETPITTRGSDGERLVSLNRSLELLKDSFPTPIGIGFSRQILVKKFGHLELYPDYVKGVLNMWLEIIIEQGILIFILWIILLFYPFYFFKKNKMIDKTLSLPFFSLILGPMQFSEPIFHPVVMILFIILLGQLKAFKEDSN